MEQHGLWVFTRQRKGCLMRYDRTVRVHSDFATTAAAVRDALAVQGFGVLTEIDVTATLKMKLGHDMEPYLILGACNPPLAKQALDVDRKVGLLLPCNVVVRGDGEDTVVQALDPNTMVEVAAEPGLRAVAEEATRRLDAALASLSTG